ncbi:MAG TPA: YciI family protein [Acidimicrobiia bacterium]|jgi:hypothetical protein
MQFVVLIYQGTTPLPNTPAWDTLTADEQKAVYADYGRLNNTPGVSQGLPLGLPTNAKTVRVEAGNTVVKDGPFVDDKGAVGGYFVFEADGIDAAIEVASHIPAARHGGAIEIRPAETYW